MRGLWKTGLFITCMIAGVWTVSHDHKLCRGYLPENDLRIPIRNFKTKSALNPGLSKKTTDKVIEIALEVYGPVIEKKFGKTLKIVNNWKDERVNAFATRPWFSNTYHVEIWGGLARHEEMTVDGLITVLCHEIGHHIGGAPKNVGFFGMNSWASVEGQSDYWASMKCAKRIYEDYDNVAILSNRFQKFKKAKTKIGKTKNFVSKLVVKKCENIFSDSDDIALCARSANGALSVTRMLAKARKSKDLPTFETPTDKEVDRTVSTHPEPQCRLDTYLAGALCTLSYDESVSQVNPNKGVCNRFKTNRGNIEGSRSKCWYKPSNSKVLANRKSKKVLSEDELFEKSKGKQEVYY